MTEMAAGGGAVVRVGERLLRFSREAVVRVAAVSGLTRLAGLPRGVAGVLVQDGCVVPVVEAGAVGARPDAAWILILRLDDALMGVPVDDLESLETQEELDLLAETAAPGGVAQESEPETVWRQALGAVAGKAKA